MRYLNSYFFLNCVSQVTYTIT